MRRDKRGNRSGSFKSQRKCGWGLGLYRNRAKGWIGGVCAGLADHWEVPAWVVRLGALALLIFSGSLAFWGYVVAWFLLAPRPNRWDEGEVCEEVELEYDEDLHAYRKRTVFRYSDAPSERLRKARERLDEALGRVESMERYVTSRRYDLNREFSKL